MHSLIKTNNLNSLWAPETLLHAAIAPPVALWPQIVLDCERLLSSFPWGETDLLGPAEVQSALGRMLFIYQIPLRITPQQFVCVTVLKQPLCRFVQNLYDASRTRLRETSAVWLNTNYHTKGAKNKSQEPVLAAARAVPLATPPAGSGGPRMGNLREPAKPFRRGNGAAPFM